MRRSLSPPGYYASLILQGATQAFFSENNFMPDDEQAEELIDRSIAIADRFEQKVGDIVEAQYEAEKARLKAEADARDAEDAARREKEQAERDERLRKELAERDAERAAPRKHGAPKV